MYTPEEVQDFDDAPRRQQPQPTPQEKPQPVETKPEPAEHQSADIEDAKVVEENTGDPLEQKISPATWTKLCKSVMLCKDLDGKPMGVSTMFDRAKAVYGVKLGTDLTGKMVETIENEWFKEWEQGSWKK
jgi:hypothetical protein